MQFIRLEEPAGAYPGSFFRDRRSASATGPLPGLLPTQRSTGGFSASQPPFLLHYLLVQHAFGGSAGRSGRRAGRPCKTFLQGLSSEGHAFFSLDCGEFCRI